MVSVRTNNSLILMGVGQKCCVLKARIVMIPKVIHYCWFGGNPLPELARKCIESWQKYCPDYQIIEWNEGNFDFSSCDYALEAYKAQKWAFISDYARLKILVEHGGIYMDTDVELIKPLDKFLNEQAFSGFEDECCVPTGIMACEKNFKLFEILLKRYDARKFVNPDGTFDTTTNVVEITKYLASNGLLLNNQKQTIDGLTLYPKEYFCPKSNTTGKIECTNNTHAIHHFAGSWLTLWERCKTVIIRLLGRNIMEKILNIRTWLRQ